MTNSDYTLQIGTYIVQPFSKDLSIIGGLFAAWIIAVSVVVVSPRLAWGELGSP